MVVLETNAALAKTCSSSLLQDLALDAVWPTLHCCDRRCDTILVADLKDAGIFEVD